MARPADRPALRGQAVRRVVKLLRPLRDGISISLLAADQAAKGVVLEAVRRRRGRVALAVVQLSKGTLCIVTVIHIPAARIHHPRHSVKPVADFAVLLRCAGVGVGTR